MQFVCVHPHAGVGCDGAGRRAEGLCSNINGKWPKRVFAGLVWTLSSVRAPVKELLPIYPFCTLIVIYVRENKIRALPPLLPLCPQVTLMWYIVVYSGL